MGVETEDMYFYRGLINARLGKKEQSLADLEAAIKLNPDIKEKIISMQKSSDVFAGIQDTEQFKKIIGA